MKFYGVLRWAIPLLMLPYAQAQDARYSFYKALSGQLLPDAEGQERFVLLDPAIPIDTDTGSEGRIGALLKRLADAAPESFLLGLDHGLVSEKLSSHLGNFDFTAGTATLTKEEIELLYQDEEQQTPTANYKIFLERNKTLQGLTEQLSTTTLKAKRDLLKAQIDAARVALAAAPDAKRIETVHRKLTLQGSPLSQNSLIAALQGNAPVIVYPAVNQWMVDSGFTTLTMRLNAPYPVPADMPLLPNAPGTPLASPFSIMASKDLGANVQRQFLPAPGSVKVTLEIKRVLINPQGQPLALLAADKSWKWKPTDKLPQFSSGKFPPSANGPAALVHARMSSLVIGRMIQIQTGTDFPEDDYRKIFTVMEDSSKTPFFASVPLRHSETGGQDQYPTYMSAASKSLIVMPQPVVIGATVTVLERR